MRVEGIYTYEQLRLVGVSRAGVRRAIAEGRIERVAHGWYVKGDANPKVVRALRMGGRVGCLSGCERYGLWVPFSRELHVVVALPRDVGRFERMPGICVHSYVGRRTNEPVWSLMDCLEQVVRNHDPETVLIVLESAMNLGLITSDDAVVLLENHPRKGTRLIKHLDFSESGTETRVRYFLRQCRVKVEPQVWITEEDRVDLLVGKSLIIECDSTAFHSSQQSYEADRRRDTRLRNLGYDVWRLSYRQVWIDWAETQLDLQHEFRRRRHFREPVPRFPNL